MFYPIFKFELRYWLINPLTYLYAFILLALSTLSMWAIGIDTPPSSDKLINSPYQLLLMASYFEKLLLLLIPAIMGYSIYRDFSTQSYQLLYSYPITKAGYFWGKFLSSLIIVSILSSIIIIGLFTGTLFPGIPTSLLAPLQLLSYLQVYLLFLWPTVVLFGAITFAIIALSRNIYAGFITILILLLLQGILTGILGGSSFIAALVDPLGLRAIQYATQYWNITDQNELLLPMKPVVWGNRLIWLVITLFIILTLYSFFQLSQHPLLLKKKKATPTKGVQIGPILKLALPVVNYHYSFSSQLKKVWPLSAFELRKIFSSWMFLSILGAGIIFIIIQQAQANPPYGFKILPVTWQMIKIPTILFSGIIQLLTFLYAGFLLHESRLAGMNALENTSATPNWVFYGAKFLALVIMQGLLLSLIIIGGVTIQWYEGFQNINAGLYLFELYIIKWPGLIIWAIAALFIQNLVKNPYLGLILLLLGSLGISGLPELGISALSLRFNSTPPLSYSDMDGYGRNLPGFFLYRAYWMIAAVILFIAGIALYRRHITFHIKERLQLALSSLKYKLGYMLVIAIVVFLAMGFTLYKLEQSPTQFAPTSTEEVSWKAKREQLYQHYSQLPQPKISAVQMKVDLFPKTGDMKADGHFWLVNRSEQAIDTLLINYSFKERTVYQLEVGYKSISVDSIHKLDIIALSQSLQTGDSLRLLFTVNTLPNSLLHHNNRIKKNGTFFTDHIFPGIGYNPIEIMDKDRRKNYGLPVDDKAGISALDSSQLNISYSGMDADWIRFEAIVSTDSSQVGIAPGYLKRSWVENNRRFFHYKMDGQIKDFYGFNSGRFAIKKDNWQDVDLEIYYHPVHHYNLESMMDGMKAALAYNSAHFSPYPHQQARIIEFPITYGTHATTFANSVPFSEANFLIDNKGTSIDLPFYIAAHEMAHQWWGNQLIPADVRGSRVLTESLAEYSALRALQTASGAEATLKFLNINHDLYLKSRGKKQDPERPLAYALAHQEYLTYRKGSIVMYALSEYLGEEAFNKVLKDFIHDWRFQAPPYPTADDLVTAISTVMPDSLSYMIDDFFYNICLYHNCIEQVEIKPLKNGQFELQIDLSIQKKYVDGRGQILEDQLPLRDYIEIGVQDENGEYLYLKKHKFTNNSAQLSIKLNERPGKVSIDPRKLLIDDLREGK
jgi:ABC-2 type transport system permease protein